MRFSRIVAKTPLSLAVAAALAMSGCDDTPEVPANVQELVRQREEAEQRMSEELARKRREKKLIEPADEPLVDSRPPEGAPANAEPGIDHTEAPLDEVEPPAIPTSPAAPRKSATALRWDGMKAGMTTDDVIALLGRPSQIARDDFFLEYWYYGQGRGAGRVAFIRGSQKTIAWDPPIN